MQNQELKEEVLKKNQDINLNDYWYDFVETDFLAKLKSYGFLDAETNFSGFYCQGDGACFDCNKFEVTKLIDNVQMEAKDKNRLKSLLRSSQDIFSINMILINTHYHHERTRKISFDYYTDYTRINKLVNRFEKALEAFRIYLCQDYYKKLEEEYEQLTSDKSILETLEVNKDTYFFLDNGTIVKEL